MLSKSLELGSCGVQWQPPDGTIGAHTETELVITDDTGLRWRIRVLPVEFAIAPGEEAALSEDLHASAGDRTPIVQAKLGAIGAGRLARVVRRFSNQHGDEVAVGDLFIPVEKGTVEIRVMARSEDPLARVGDALDTVLGSLEIVTLPDRPAEVTLPEPGCAVTAPMRFVAAPTVAGSGKGELVRLGVDDWKRTIEVWRIGRHKLKGKDMHAALVEHANKTAAESGSHAVSHSAPIDDFGVCVQIQQYVTWERDDGPHHAVYRWWIAGDGTLWRVGESAPGVVDREAMAGDVAAVQDSFRRI
jgi:hypothetical protein